MSSSGGWESRDLQQMPQTWSDCAFFLMSCWMSWPGGKARTVLLCVSQQAGQGKQYNFNVGQLISLTHSVPPGCAWITIDQADRQPIPSATCAEDIQKIVMYVRVLRTYRTYSSNSSRGSGKLVCIVHAWRAGDKLPFQNSVSQGKSLQAADWVCKWWV